MTLTLESLSVRFGAIEALQGVSCAAQSGRITALLGPNAAGKSTLLRACTGSIRPSSGCVLLDGRPVGEWPLRGLAARMAYVPQQAQVSAAFTVREIVDLGRYALAACRKKVDDAMLTMGVSDLEDRLFLQLSQGQQQRVSMARALAQVDSAGILILDEPMSAMDLHHMLATLRMLRHRASEGMTVILALHDFDAARHFADDVWILEGGRLKAWGSVHDVLRPDAVGRLFRAEFHELAAPSGEIHLVPSFEAPAPHER